uniref:Uncharacterized protein n=1 Tax=Pipistrellus kuhlii TaxID=59472 RepID=A0A7J7RTL8_PIPKU|nr:hypothetical protein mPipKuh1_010371 [Pipistrellus kuhlii]
MGAFVVQQASTSVSPGMKAACLTSALKNASPVRQRPLDSSAGFPWLQQTFEVAVPSVSCSRHLWASVLHVAPSASVFSRRLPRAGGQTFPLAEPPQFSGKPLRNSFSPHQFGSVGRASACGLKGPQFDSGQGHVP